MPDWNWNGSQNESGVVHQSTANTDHDDATTLKQGYDYANFSEITPDPVACWPLHEDSGTTAYDLAGTNDGAINGATVGQEGLLGTTAYSFDGADDKVDANPALGDITTDGFTWSCWIKTSGSISSSQVPVTQWTNGGFTYFAFELGRNGNGNFIITFRSDAGNFQAIDSGVQIDDNEWHHMVAVIDITNSQVRGYLDSVEEVNQSNIEAGNNFSFSNDDTYLGYRGGNNDWYFAGLIADVRPYSTALSASQATALYDVVASQGTWTGTAKPL